MERVSKSARPTWGGISRLKSVRWAKLSDEITATRNMFWGCRWEVVSSDVAIKPDPLNRRVYVHKLRFMRLISQWPLGRRGGDPGRGLIR
jgi:hypothetical protein